MFFQKRICSSELQFLFHDRWLVSHHHWTGGERQWERKRSEGWSTEAISMMRWEFTQNNFCLSFLDRGAVSATTDEETLSALLWFREDSRWRARDVTVLPSTLRSFNLCVLSTSSHTLLVLTVDPVLCTWSTNFNSCNSQNHPPGWH